MANTEALLVIDPEAGIVWRVFKNGSRKQVGSRRPDGYLFAKIHGSMVRLHRVIWEHVNGPIGQNMQIDHINGIRDDNRLVNLRTVTNSENSQNRRLALAGNVSGVKGVNWHSRDQVWESRIGIGGKQYHLGSFQTIGEAEAAYQGAAAILHTHNPHAKKEGPAETGPKGSNTQEMALTHGTIL